MRSANTVDIEGVVAALTELGVVHRLVGAAPRITKVCSLLHKEPNGLYYYTGDDPSVFGTLTSSVVMCAASAAVPAGDNAALVVEGDVQQVFYRLCAQLFGQGPEPGVHPTAIVHPEAVVGSGVHIGPYAVIGRSVIGNSVVIHAHVVIMDGCEIGDRTVIEPNSCIGATGVAWVWDEAGNRIVLPQLGGVTVQEDVFLGTDVTIVRGMINETTVIERGCMIAHGTKIGHSVWMGRDCHVANNVSIAGSARIGPRSFLGAGCSIRPHAKLAQGTIVGVGAAVVKDVEEPGTILAGVPAKAMPGKERPSGMPKPTRPAH